MAGLQEYDTTDTFVADGSRQLARALTASNEGSGATAVAQMGVDDRIACL